MFLCALQSALPIGTRLTRFCIKMEADIVLKELKYAFEKLGYCWKHSAPPGQVFYTLFCVDIFYSD